MPLHKSQVRGDDLLFRLLQGDVGRGELENNLLREFQKDYPLSKLRLLLNSTDDRMVAAGIWIASELGAKARPLFADIVRLIRHRLKQVRFFALDCIATCATPQDGNVISLCLDGLEDTEPAVIWKTMTFIVNASPLLLRAAMAREITSEAGLVSTRAQGLALALDPSNPHNVAKIISFLGGTDALLRRYAAAAAVRVAQHDPRPLKNALISEDPIIRRFATDMAVRADM